MQLVKPLDASTSLNHSTISAVVRPAQTPPIHYFNIPLQNNTLNTSASQDEDQLPVQNFLPPRECCLRQIHDSCPVVSLHAASSVKTVETAFKCCASDRLANNSVSNIHIPVQT
jgi:hypothetical protein